MEGSMEMHQEYPAWEKGTCSSEISNCEEGNSGRVTRTMWKRHFMKILNIQNQFDA